MDERRKTCFRCVQSKPIGEFYAHPMMGDGRLGKCKECTKAEEAQRRAERPVYYIWRDIMRRCDDPRREEYPNYGGRGITVCAGFRVSDNFEAAMGERPSAKLSVDRIRNNDGYWCGACDECVGLARTMNCRWATRTEQANNTRQNRLITFNGETMTLTQWAHRSGLPVWLLWERLKRGWDMARSIGTPRKRAA